MHELLHDDDIIAFLSLYMDACYMS